MAAASTTPVLPLVGDTYLGSYPGAHAPHLAWTVTDVTPIKVVLAHPLAGELHLPHDDFKHMVAVGSLTVEP